MDEDWKNLSFEEYKNKLIEINPNLVLGDDYDLEGAYDAGLIPYKNGNLGSRNPHTGRILKRPNHPTFSQAVETELALGYKVYSHEGETYSVSPTEIEMINNTSKNSEKIYLGGDLDPVVISVRGYMKDVANYIQKNPFDADAYINKRFYSPESRIEFVKRMDPEKYKEELYNEAMLMRDKELAPIYKDAMKKEYLQTKDESLVEEYLKRFNENIND